jgi:hypothetical protein
MAEGAARFQRRTRDTGWKSATVETKHLWTAEIPDVRDGRWNFRQLWINGQSATRARNPNTGFMQVE